MFLNDGQRADGGGGGERAAGKLADPMPVLRARGEQFVAGQFKRVTQTRGAMEKFKVQSSKFKGSSKPQASIPNGLSARLGVLGLGFPLSFEL